MQMKQDRPENGGSANQLKTGIDISGMTAFVLITAVAAYLLFSVSRATHFPAVEKLQVFNTIFISILMQAFPFMLIGIFVSSAMAVFIPDTAVLKIFPNKFGLGFITALFAGLLFPVCECAIVPVTTRLVKKGVALPIAITFMLSAPIINPIVIISTLYAFPGQPQIALFRVIFGLAIALLVGLFLLLFSVDNKALISEHHHADCDGHHHCCCCDAPIGNDATSNFSTCSMPEKIQAMFLHAGEEFFSVGRYLVLGALLTSLIQILVPRTWFSHLSAYNGLALLIMMTIAFIFSACSTSDAFIAKSFTGRFSLGAIMGFLIFGPMMDIKNILMLLANFKKKFVAALVLIIFIANFFMLYFFAFLI